MCESDATSSSWRKTEDAFSANSAEADEELVWDARGRPHLGT